MRGWRLFPAPVLVLMTMTAAPAAFASGGTNSGGVNAGGGAGGGGGGGTGTLTTAPCATVSASAATLNQGGATSIRVSGTATSCSDVDETVYVQIEDLSGRLHTATLTPPNTAGGSCYICDSLLAAHKSWSFSSTWSVIADGSTYPFSLTVLHRDSMSSTPVVLTSQQVSTTTPVTRNA